MHDNPIDLYKLLVFKTYESTYVVLDKIIEESLKRKIKRISYTWEELVKHFEELEMGDIFYIDERYTSGDKIEVRISDYKTYVKLTKEALMLIREKNYLEKCRDYSTNSENFQNLDNPERLVNEIFPKFTWNYDQIKILFSNEIDLDASLKIKVPMTNLFQFVLLANEISRSGWGLARFFIHRKTKKTYKEFRTEYKKLYGK